MFRPLYKFFFEKAGWRISGSIPSTLNKYVMIVAPHTSNWDFLVGLAARSILRIDTKFLGKKELFRFPMGILFRCWGGYPVDRSGHHNMVDEVVKIFNAHEKFSIALAPEGTRKPVANWKTGFYHIACKAGVPIIMTGFDYASKTVIIHPPFYPQGRLESDMQIIRSHFEGTRGKYPRADPSFLKNKKQ